MCASGEAPSRPAELAALELGLAQQSGLYLLVDPARRVVEVKARGIVLDAVAVTGFAVLGHRPARRAAPPPTIELPAVFTVEEDAVAAHRRLLAPAELVPYSEESEEGASPPAAGTGSEEAPVPVPPGAYRVRLEAGWALDVGARVPATGPLSWLDLALREGWSRLRRQPVETPALVALALEPEDGRRLHHLLRRGTRILVAGVAEADQPRVSCR